MDARGGEFREIGFEIAVEEVEDVVAGGIHAGGESGPGYGGESWERRAKAAKTALLREARKVRELAFGDELLGESRVQAVEPEEDELPDFGLMAAVEPGREQAPAGAKRPHQDGEDAEQEGEEDGEEGAQESEARARSDVGDGVDHRSLPSTRKTSKTLSCWMGPWPK